METDYSDERKRKGNDEMNRHDEMMRMWHRKE